MQTKNMNNALVSYILQRKYWLKSTKVPKRKWKRAIVNTFIDSGESKKYSENSFIETWNALEKEGLV